MEIENYLAQQVAQPDEPAQPSGETSSPFDPLGLIMIGGLIAFMYFFMIRPQRRSEKQKKEMLTTLKRGDTVVTSSGIIGSVASIKEESVLLKVGDSTRIEFLKTAISHLRTSSSSDSSVTGKKRSRPAN